VFDKEIYRKKSTKNTNITLLYGTQLEFLFDRKPPDVCDTLFRAASIKIFDPQQRRYKLFQSVKTLVDIQDQVNPNLEWMALIYIRF
jgi:hypothetical protein